MGLLLTASRKKFGQMQEKLYGSPQWQAKLKASKLSSIMPSSWVNTFVWDRKTQTLTLTTLKGHTYTWPNIPEDLAEKITLGLATCRTNDPTGQNRWQLGKNPSLGAAFWTYLKGRGLLAQIIQLLFDIGDD